MNLEQLEQLERFKPYVDTAEAAELLGISRQRVWQLLNEGKLEGFQFLGVRRVLFRAIVKRIKGRVKIPPRGVVAMQ